jgi:hypothetical protein
MKQISTLVWDETVFREDYINDMAVALGVDPSDITIISVTGNFAR